MLKRGVDKYGNLSANQKRVAIVSDALTPVVSRKVCELAAWQQNLIEFNWDNRPVKDAWKRYCLICGRKEKDCVLNICLAKSNLNSVRYFHTIMFMEHNLSLS